MAEMNTPIGTIYSTKGLNEFTELASIAPSQFLLALADDENNMGGKITLLLLIASMISADTDNLLGIDVDGLLKVSADSIATDIISTDADNLLTQGTDDKLNVSPLDISPAVISDDVDNLLAVGTDGKLAVQLSLAGAANTDLSNLSADGNFRLTSAPFALNSGYTTSGEADILAYSGTTVNFKVDNNASYKPLAITYADKSQETLTSLTSITEVRTRCSSILATMTSNTAPSGYTASASSQFNTSYQAFYAFDKNNLTNSASSTGGFPYYLQITIPTAKTAKYAKFRTSGYLPSAFTLWGSNNGGTTKVTLYTYTGFPLNGTTDYYLVLNNITDYSTYGLSITSNVSGGEAQVSELDFFEDNPAGTVYLDGAYTVIKEKDGNPSALLSTKVTQGKTFPTSPSNGDYHCLTATGLQSYKRVAGAWVETQYTVLGTVTVSGNVITAVTTNGYNQNGYEINFNSTLSIGTSLAKSIPNLVMPNYTSGVAKSWNTSYLADTDGYLYVQADYGATFYVSADNSNWITFALSRFDGQGFGNGVLMPVPKGIYYKAVYANSRATSLIFYPAKGAS
jgi:hypothetical protein